MKRKVSFLISALCALGACASFTACMTDSQNGKDENIEKAKANTHIVEQQSGGDKECPDGNCPAQKSEAPDMENMPPMPEFRFMPHHGHMPNPMDIGGNAEGDNGSSVSKNSTSGEAEDEEKPEDGETPEEDKKPPMPAPRKGGKIKPKMPKKGN